MPQTDIRSIVGNEVNALAKHVTHESNAKRLFGSNWKTKRVTGIVTSAETRQAQGNARASWFVTATYSLNEEMQKTTELNRRSIKAGPVPAAPAAAPVVPAGAAPAPAAATPPELAAPAAAPAAPPAAGAAAADAAAAAPAAAGSAAAPPVAPAAPPEPAAPAAAPAGAPPAPPAAAADAAAAAPAAAGSAAATCHGRQWFSCSRSTRVHAPIPRREWYTYDQLGNRIHPGSGAGRNMSRLDFFLAMFPPDQFTALFELTNIQLAKHNEPLTTRSEILKLLGVIILITRFKFGDRRDLWKKESGFKYRTAANLGQTGMTRHRFEVLWRHHRWSDQPAVRPPNMSHEAYRWSRVFDHRDRFNAWRASNFVPSDWICVDESISRWYGLGGHWINMGLPQYVAIDRKPENGCEIQDACCGRSGVMIRIKIVETADAHADEEHDSDDTNDGLNHGTIIIKELVSPWIGSGVTRVVCADSYFASVSTLVELKRLGFAFVGVVKTATKQFPMAYLQSQELTARGDLRAVVSKDDQGHNCMLAFVWVDRERRYFICNGGGLDPAMPIFRERWRQVDETVNAEPEHVQLEIPQPQATDIYYSVCGRIDQSNRTRQDDLEIERLLRTHDWSIRVNLSIFGIELVDTYYVYNGCSNNKENPDTFFTNLSEEMIDNTLDQRSSRARLAQIPEANQNLPIQSPHLTPTKKRRRNRNGNITDKTLQGNCRVCKKSTTWTCNLCKAQDPGGPEPWCCHTKNRGRTCWREHCQQKHPN